MEIALTPCKLCSGFFLALWPPFTSIPQACASPNPQQWIWTQERGEEEEMNCETRKFLSRNYFYIGFQLESPGILLFWLRGGNEFLHKFAIDPSYYPNLFLYRVVFPSVSALLWSHRFRLNFVANFLIFQKKFKIHELL